MNDISMSSFSLRDCLNSKTIEAINQYHIDQEERVHYQYIRGSEIGHSCERALWYRFRWVHNPETFGGQQLRLFETGHREEARLILDLKNVGIIVNSFGDNGEDQIAVSALDGHFRGHLDGEILGLLETPKTKHLLELKTHNTKSFKQLKEHGLEVSKPEHLEQMMIYMHLRSLMRGCYLAKCKDTDELYLERVHYNEAHALQLMAKAERILNAHGSPLRVSDKPDYYLCKAFECPSYGVCHEDQHALRNCRKCLHSKTSGKGRWYCNRHDHYLNYEDQLNGCPNHLYLPTLVHGEQIDTDEKAETVIYQMTDGVWIDGAERQET